MKVRVKADGDEVVIGVLSGLGGMDVRLSLEEVEEFVEELDLATDDATRCSENRRADEVRNLAPQVFSKDGME